MGGAKKRVPAIEGWFRIEEPALLGTRCGDCGTIFFPKETDFCRNPECSGTDFEEVPLSRRGRLWSFTDNHYAPPAPALRLVSATQIHSTRPVPGYLCERAGLLPELHELRLGSRDLTPLPPCIPELQPHRYELVWRVVRKRSQQHPVHQAEDRGVRTDSQGKCDHHHGGESRSATQ